MVRTPRCQEGANKTLLSRAGLPETKEVAVTGMMMVTSMLARLDDPAARQSW